MGNSGAAVLLDDVKKALDGGAAHPHTVSDACTKEVVGVICARSPIALTTKDILQDAEQRRKQMEISELTGLPKLPEGQFWRVEDAKAPRFLEPFGGRPVGVDVVIMRSKQVGKTQDKIIHLPFGMEFAWGYETVLVDEEEVLFREAVVRIETSHTNVYDADDNLIGIRDVDREVPVNGGELTAELIFTACEKALVRQAAIQKSKAYLGDYPPKHIDREN